MNRKHLEDMSEPEIRQMMTAIAQMVETIASVFLIDRPLFALLLFNDPKISQYVGNCQRDQIVTAFREAAARLANREDFSRG